MISINQKSLGSPMTVCDALFKFVNSTAPIIVGNRLAARIYHIIRKDTVP